MARNGRKLVLSWKRPHCRDTCLASAKSRSPALRPTGGGRVTVPRGDGRRGHLATADCAPVTYQFSHNSFGNVAKCISGARSKRPPACRCCVPFVFPILSPNGATYTSPGQRPGCRSTQPICTLKGCDNPPPCPPLPTLAAPPTMSRPFRLNPFVVPIPKGVPWAGMSRPFRPETPTLADRLLDGRTRTCAGGGSEAA